MTWQILLKTDTVIVRQIDAQNIRCAKLASRLPPENNRTLLGCKRSLSGKVSVQGGSESHRFDTVDKFR